MPDILIRGVALPKYGCAGCYFKTGKYCGIIAKNENVEEYSLRAERHPDCHLVELPPHGDLIETKDVLLALVEHGQRDKRFKLGDTIRYSPSEVKEIIDASVPVVVPAERREAT